MFRSVARLSGKHKLPELPYALDALQPHISAETLQYHHGKHHAAYVTKLNQLVEAQPSLGSKSLEEIIKTEEGVVFNQVFLASMPLTGLSLKQNMICSTKSAGRTDMEPYFLLALHEGKRGWPACRRHKTEDYIGLRQRRNIQGAVFCMCRRTLWLRMGLAGAGE
eukprot:GHVS01004455.1.p1 GENE.GHVS01004455.1~~GHVS01004455.1.p1  ORF type:complete len:165 (-),score=8.47 GHVS01004455.1:419-913(-)